MGWLAGRMTEWLIIHGAVEEEDRDLYEYASICLLMTAAPLFLAILVGGVMGELRTAVLMILPFMVLRKISDGYHAKHAATCLVCSSGLLVLCIFIAANITFSRALCISMFAGTALLFLFSPVDSENKRLNEEEKKRYRKAAGILALAVCVIAVAGKVCGNERLAVCMAVGLLLTLALQIPCVLQRGMGKLAKISVFTLSFFSLYLALGFLSDAKETEPASLQEIVVVLDCSQSMKEVDDGYASFDFAKMLSAVLPRDYRVGVAAYREEVCATLPLGSSHAMIEDALEDIGYQNYGNAGAGLAAAVQMFDDAAASKRIILISDGEIMMKTAEGTQESADLFAQAVEQARRDDIVIDVVALGPRIEEGDTVYSAAEATGGFLNELSDGEQLGDFAEKLIFEQWKLKASHVGKISGLSGELSVKLPDCLMSKAKLVLLGSQQNENMTINCEAERVNLSKGGNYTVIELLNPSSEEVKIQMGADSPMDVSAYLTAEYDFCLLADYTYTSAVQTANFGLKITNQDGLNMLDGHLKDGGVQLFLDDEQQTYRLTGDALRLSRKYAQDATVRLRVAFDGLYGNYYGDTEETVEVQVPVVEEVPPEPKIDWFFWSVIAAFAAALVIIVLLAYRQKKRSFDRRKMIDAGRALPRETGNRRSEFNGKLQIYVIHNKDGIDYPPESINLFARCNREIITLEWLLDICNLPLNVKGAERIIIRPGDDRSLIIKNNSKATVLMGREFLVKGHAYHLYYGEKVTFIFDQEDTEIEVHYRDLKPNER